MCYGTGVHFHDYGLGGFDGELAVIESIKINYEEEKPSLKIKTLETIMKVRLQSFSINSHATVAYS